MGEGAFIELEKLYNLDEPTTVFRGDPKSRAKEALTCLEALLKELDTNSSAKEETNADSSSKKEAAPATKVWSQVEDPSSGGQYWYNSVTGASQWEDPTL